MADPPANKKTLTVREIAGVLGIHPQTLRAKLREGRFPLAPLPIPGRRLFSAEAFEQLLRGKA